MSSMSRLFSSLSLQESHQTLAVRHFKRGLRWIVTANATYSSSTVLTATNFQNESKARRDFSVPSSFPLGTPMFHWFHSPSKKYPYHRKNDSKPFSQTFLKKMQKHCCNASEILTHKNLPLVPRFGSGLRSFWTFHLEHLGTWWSMPAASSRGVACWRCF